MNKKINNNKKEDNNIFMNGLNFIGCDMNGALFQTIITENNAETEDAVPEDMEKVPTMVNLQNPKHLPH